MRRIQILLLLALTALAGAAFPQAPGSRQEALAGLASTEAATRAAAVAWIARNGAPGDEAPLYDRLKDESATVRNFAEQALWLLWSRSGNAEIDRLMALGTAAMQAGRHTEAIGVFSGIIERKPEFAEGWNRRATVYYLAGQYDKSIADCHEVLKRNPRHFGALSGLGQIYVQLEDYDNALRWYRRALEVNPNMLGVEMNIRLLEEKLKDQPAPGRST